MNLSPRPGASPVAGKSSGCQYSLTAAQAELELEHCEKSDRCVQRSPTFDLLGLGGTAFGSLASRLIRCFQLAKQTGAEYDMTSGLGSVV